jgi:hypothetical protein
MLSAPSRFLCSAPRQFRIFALAMLAAGVLLGVLILAAGVLGVLGAAALARAGRRR